MDFNAPTSLIHESLLERSNFSDEHQLDLSTPAADAQSDQSQENEISGVVSKSIVTYKWTIENFREKAAVARMGELIESPLFSKIWFLILFPRGENEESKHLFCIYLCNRRGTETTQSFAISILNKNGKKVDSFVMRNAKFEHFDEGYDMWGDKSNLKFGYLINSSNGIVGTGRSGALTIQCELLYDEDQIKRCEEENEIILMNSAPESVPKEFQSFRSLLNEKELSDVAFEFDDDDDDVIYAHKLILTLRSPVFQTMFRNGMQESHGKTVFLDNVKSKVFKRFLNFLYTGNVNVVDSATAADLFELAAKYMVEELQKKCVDVMKRSVALENALRYFILSDTHHVQELNYHVVFFMKMNSEKILNMAEFQILKLEKPTFASAIEDKLNQNVKRKRKINDI